MRAKSISLVKIFAALLFLGNVSLLAQLTNNDMVHYRDQTNGFVIWYPKIWAKVPETLPSTKLKVVSRAGLGNCDFSVTVLSNPIYRSMTAAKATELVLKNPEALLARLKREYPDAKIIQLIETKLNNRAAYSVTFDATFRSVGVDVPMRFLMVSSVDGDRAFTLIGRAPPEEFENTRPEFLLMMSGFRTTQN